MKVLVLANFGMGLHNFRKELLQELIDLKHEVYVSLPYDEYVPLLTNFGCKYIPTNVDRRGTNLITDLKLLFSYIDNIKKVKPDIVLTYTIKPNIYGGIACRITNTPYLTNITGLGTAVENRNLMQVVTLNLYKVALRQAKCVFFQNEPHRKFFSEKKIVESNVEILPGSGVNLQEYKLLNYPENDGIIKFLYIGRIMKAKGIDELIVAAKDIKQKYDNVEFELVGFCEEEYLEQLNELHNLGIIRFHGQQTNVKSYLERSHATILPSYHEGTSNVLLESAASGRPILASNVTGCRETFDENTSGFGFEAKDTESLKEAIIKFMKLPYEEKKKMGLEGRKKIKREYDRKIVIDAYLNQIIE
jgi:galacturonosyltransferase